MFHIHSRIDGVPQLVHGPYYQRDDALRTINALWTKRWFPIRQAHQRIEFEIVGRDGEMWQHRAIMQEIRSRPDLREPERIR
jgi:hypothetical protein